MFRRIIPILCLLATTIASGQVLSQQGRFSVDFAKGCAPFTVHVNELDTFGNITRQYFYERGTSETTATTYTYSAPGTYQIVQIVGIDVTPKTDTLTVEVFEPTEPRFSVEKCNLNGIIITGRESLYDSLRIYFTPTDSIDIAADGNTSFNYPTPGSQSFSIRGLYEQAQANCTRYNYSVDAIATLTTPQITFTRVRETCRDFFALTLGVTGYDSLIDYQVVFEQPTADIIYQGRIASDSLIIPDIDYDRTESQYCVRINAIDNCTGAIVNGTPFCQPITPLSATPFEDLYSTYNTTGVFISMDTVPSGNLLVYRRLEGEDNFVLRGTTQDAFQDPISSTARAYFYRIDYLDSCGQTLFTTETNPPLISSDRLEENSYDITYTPPVNQLLGSNSPSYEIGNISTTTAPITSSVFNLRLDPANGTRQFLTASALYDNGISIRSNQLTYKYIPIIYVPTAFTPNGDGLNDTLELFGLPTTEATTNIYNRWGKLIYTSDEPSPGWDGFLNGKLAQEGGYMYEVIFKDSDGAEIRQKGTFALIKK